MEKVGGGGGGLCRVVDRIYIKVVMGKSRLIQTNFKCILNKK